MMDTTQPTQTKAVESAHDLWGLPLQGAGCPACEQSFLVLPEQIGSLCPNCSREKLAPQPAVLSSQPPELFVPFVKERADLLPILRGFIKDVKLRPSDMRPQTMLKRALPVYWPMWLVDGDVHGEWKATAGFEYQLQSSKDSYGNGGWQSEKQIESRIRWEPRMGNISRHYDNLAIAALSDEDKLQSLIGEYDLNQAVLYQPDKAAEQMSGCTLRVPDIHPENAEGQAKTRLKKAAEEECCQAAGAQRAQNFRLQASFEALQWTQLMLPMYCTCYFDDEGQAHPIAINGQTGEIGGVRLASQKKGTRLAILIAILGLVLFISGALLRILMASEPLFSVSGILLLIAGLGVAGTALVPALYPARWNRAQREDGSI